MIAANTNWKYASVDCGNDQLPGRPEVRDDTLACEVMARRIDPGFPRDCSRTRSSIRKKWIGEPKPILKPHNTQTISTSANAMKAIIIEFTDQRFCITPP